MMFLLMDDAYLRHSAHLELIDRRLAAALVT